MADELWKPSRFSTVSKTKDEGIWLSFNLSDGVLVMVPTLNEELGMKKVLEDMPKGSVVLVVDGGSTDETIDVAKQHQAIVIKQRFGKGKGCGVRTGMEYFLATDYDILCIIDGDGSNDPRELPKMIEVLENRNAEVVLGSRIRGKEKKAQWVRSQSSPT